MPPNLELAPPHKAQDRLSLQTQELVRMAAAGAGELSEEGKPVIRTHRIAVFE
jgi:hypothetical protein